MARLILLTGFEPFGGERTNPSWEVARRLDGLNVDGATVKAVRLPVGCRRAARSVTHAIEELRPAAILGLGQAAGRPVLSPEKVAINVADERVRRESDGGLAGTPVIPGGPDAYFSRLPLPEIIRALRAGSIPVGLSLSAGVFACNAAMYAALHTLRRRRAVQAGFIHMPYEARQAVRHHTAPSMSLDMMTAGIEITLRVIAGRI
jgi:pyroglutamyl-peptidase